MFESLLFILILLGLGVASAWGGGSGGVVGSVCSSQMLLASSVSKSSSWRRVCSASVKMSSGSGCGEGCGVGAGGVKVRFMQCGTAVACEGFSGGGLCEPFWLLMLLGLWKMSRLGLGLLSDARLNLDLFLDVCLRLGSVVVKPSQGYQSSMFWCLGGWVLSWALEVLVGPLRGVFFFLFFRLSLLRIFLLILIQPRWTLVLRVIPLLRLVLSCLRPILL